MPTCTYTHVARQANISSVSDCVYEVTILQISRLSSSRPPKRLGKTKPIVGYGSGLGSPCVYTRQYSDCVDHNTTEPTCNSVSGGSSCWGMLLQWNMTNDSCCCLVLSHMSNLFIYNSYSPYIFYKLHVVPPIYEQLRLHTILLYYSFTCDVASATVATATTTF